MSGGVIDEFLVRLGFKIDEVGQRKMQDGLAKATDLIKNVALAAEAMAVGIAAAVVKSASKFENLYWFAAKVGSSADNISAFAHAIKQVGGTEDMAKGMLAGVSQFMKSFDDEGTINSFSVATRDANGQMRDTADIVEDLGARWAEMAKTRSGLAVAFREAELLGIDNDSLQVLIRDHKQFVDEYLAGNKKIGIDQQKAAKAWTQFMQDLRDLMSMLERVKDKLLITLGPAFTKLVKWLTDAHNKTDGWSSAIVILTAALVPFIALFGPVVTLIAAAVIAVGLLVATFDQWKAKIEQVTDRLIKLIPPEIREQFRILADRLMDMADAFIGLGKAIWEKAKPYVEAYFNLLRDIGGVIKDYVAPAMSAFISTELAALNNALFNINKLIRIATALLKGDWQEAWREAARTANDSINSIGPDGEGAGVDTTVPGWNAPAGGAPAARATNDNGAPATTVSPWDQPPTTRSGRRDPIGIRQNNPGNLRSWGDRPKSGGFARFETAYEGLRAMGKNLQRYSQRGWDTVSEIISHWAPSSENNTKAYIAAVSKRLGVDADRRLNLKDSGTLQALMAAIVQHENGRNPYSAELMSAAAAAAVGKAGAPAKGGKAGVQVSQTTNIHVQGGDSRETANLVASNQDRVNADLVRNASGAFA